MFKFDEVGSTYMSLPPNLQTIENDCFGYALDKQIKKLHGLAKNLTIWSDIENADKKYYDYMALCIKAPYYRSEYTEKTKQDLLKTAISMHRYAGTRRAIDELLKLIFEKACFIPWYEYDGKPYHFNAKVFDILTEDTATVFVNVIKEVKAARSLLDNISIGREEKGNVYIGSTVHHCQKNEAIIEQYQIEKTITQKNCTGATMIPIYRAEKITENYLLNSKIHNTEQIMIATSTKQKNAEIRERYETQNIIEKTIYAEAGIHSKYKSKIEEE